MTKITSVIVDDIYPIIEKSLNSNTNNLKKCIGRFIDGRHDAIYDTGLTNRIYYGKNDIDDFFNSIKVSESAIKDIIKNCFFWDISYNPPCIKEPIIVAVFCCIRYYMIKKDRKMAQICGIYMAFTGPFYASIHGKMFKYPPKRECMDYVINNVIGTRYDIKTEGTLFGSFRIMVDIWLDRYDKEFKTRLDDDEIGSMIQQLRDRENQRIINISREYYKAYNNGEYLNYESDNYSADDFRLTDNDSLRVKNYTDIVVQYITTSDADIAICKRCSDNNITANEVKSIVEAIMFEKDYIDEIRDCIDKIISDFFQAKPGVPITSIDFLSYNLKVSTNTTNPNKLKVRDYILKWLTEKSPNYNKRRKRKPTALSYYKSVLYYMVFTIHKVVK